MGISPHWGSVKLPEVGSSNGDFEKWLKGALGGGASLSLSLSLCGGSVKGTWREGSFAGGPKGYVEKALQTGISFLRGPVW